eukprot:5944316-Amphidinium_carterae.1
MAPSVSGKLRLAWMETASPLDEAQREPGRTFSYAPRQICHDDEIIHECDVMNIWWQPELGLMPPSAYDVLEARLHEDLEQPL